MPLTQGWTDAFPIMMPESSRCFLPHLSLPCHGRPSSVVINLQLINIRQRNKDVIKWGKKLGSLIKNSVERKAEGRKGTGMPRAQEKGEQKRTEGTGRRRKRKEGAVAEDETQAQKNGYQRGQRAVWGRWRERHECVCRRIPTNSWTMPVP